MKFNGSAFSGILVAAAVLHFGVFEGLQNPSLFFNAHALILVLGGTLAATLMAFPFARMGQLLDLILLGMLFKKQTPVLTVAQQLLDWSSVPNRLGGANRGHPTPAHPFMNEAFYYLAQEELDAFELRNLLLKRSEYFKKRYLQDYKTLNALGKFPPAFGLLGATTGMIAMMTQLSGNPDQIGPAMATALVATFWGIAVANLLILPLADYAHRVVQEDQAVRSLIIEGVLALREEQPPIILFERLASQLTPEHRRELKEAYAQGQKSQPIPKKTQSQKVEHVEDETTGLTVVKPLRKKG